MNLYVKKAIIKIYVTISLYYNMKLFFPNALYLLLKFIVVCFIHIPAMKKLFLKLRIRRNMFLLWPIWSNEYRASIFYNNVNEL